MADGRSQNGKNKPNKNLFKRGSAPNPLGSSERARKLGRIRRLTIDELQEIGYSLLTYTKDELAALQSDEKTSILQYWVMSLITKSIQKADHQAFDVLMTRLIGKPPEAPVSRLLLELERQQDHDMA